MSNSLTVYYEVYMEETETGIGCVETFEDLNKCFNYVLGFVKTNRYSNICVTRNTTEVLLTFNTDTK